MASFSAPSAPPAPSTRAAPSFGSQLGRLVAVVGRVRELSLLLVLAAIVFGVWLRASHFTSAGNVRQILLSVSIIAVVAVGQTLVVLTRNVDLSVASTVGLVAYVVRDLLRDQPGFNIPLAIALGLLIGAALGAVNVALTAWVLVG
jgi:rhamnose transport system permease protein